MPSRHAHGPTRPSASAQGLYVGIAILIILFTSLACTLPAGLLIGIGPADGTLVIDRGGNERLNDALQFQQFTITAGSKDGDFALTFHNGDGLLLPIVGNNGMIVTDFGGNDQATALDRGANRLIAAGTSDQQIALAAYTQEGNLDPGFGVDGKVLTTLPGGAVINDLWVTEQDALFVAGTTGVGGVPHFLLVAYLADGSLNPGFGQNGVVTTAIGTRAQARVVKFDMAGNIVVAGHSTSASGEVLTLVRYLPDGSLDSSFGNNGIVTTSIADGDAFAYDLRYQMDGKILVAGEWRPSPSGDAQFVLARYLNDGTLDPDFDGGIDANGVILTAFSGASAVASSMTINLETNVPEIVLAGYAVASGANETFALAAYTADGSLDSRFGTGGLTTTSVGGTNARVKKVLLRADTLMAVGYSGTNFALARYTYPGGTLDPEFGRPSFISTAITNAGDSGANAVVIDNQENRLLGGYSRNVDHPNDDFALARYTGSSALDPAFGTNGIVTTDFGGSSESIKALVLHSGGNLVAAGSSNLGGSDQFALARYTADGSLDTGFGAAGTGFFTTPIGTLSRAMALVTLPDNRLIAAGFSQDAAGTGLALAAYMPNGSLDTSFGQGGIVTTTLPGGATYGVDLARHTDGSLVLVGRHEPSAPGLTQLVVARYTPTGSLDSAFGSAGIVTATLPSANVFGRAVLIQPDGKILVGGDSQATNGGNSAFLVLRYMPDGTLDPSFDSDGMAIHTLDTAQGEVRDMTVQRDGRLLVVGQAAANIRIGRFLLDDGALDTNFFGKQGWITQEVWQHHLEPAAITLISTSLAGDTVIVAGQSQGIAPAAASFYFHQQNLIETSIAQVNPGQASPNLAGLSFQMSPDALAPCTYQVVRQPTPSFVAATFEAVTFLGVSKIVASNWLMPQADDACLTGYDLKVSYTDAEVMYSGGDERNLVPMSITSSWGNNLCLEHTCTHDLGNNTLTIHNLKAPVLDLFLGFWLTEPVTARDVPAGRSIRSLPRLQIVNDSGQTCDFSATWRNFSPGGTRLGLGEMPYQWDLASTCRDALRLELVFHYTQADLRRGNAVVQSDLKAYQYVNGVWVNQCGVYACTHDELAGSFKVSGVASLGPWTLASSPPTTQQQRYVDHEATAGANNGSSWANAFTDLQTALHEANANPLTNYEIWVAEGVYTPGITRTQSFSMTHDNVQLYGGFAATETLRIERDWTTRLTVLSGDLERNDGVDASGVVTQTSAITGSNSYHVLYLDGVTHGPITSKTIIDGFTITAGQANDSAEPNDSGGGLACFGRGSQKQCSPSLSNLVVRGNTANFGGGIYLDGADGGASNPSLTNVTISGNTAQGSGGGIYNLGARGQSNPTLTNVTISGNTAQGNGGGIYNNGRDGGQSSPIITASNVISNTARANGGGMYNNGQDGGQSSPIITASNVISNTTQTDGGGMYNLGAGGQSSPSLSNVTISGNTAQSSGGGMYNNGSNGGQSSPIITATNVISNTAIDMGGGIYNFSSSPSFSNGTISGNTANFIGGGVYNTESSPSFSTVTISGNTATNGGGIYNFSSSPSFSTVTISGNTATNGGGIYNSEGSPSISTVTISGNTAVDGGGGVYNSSSSPTISNVTLSGNTARDGGGIYNFSSSPSFSTVTISGNTATDSGGGVNNAQGSPSFTNVIISGNTAGFVGGGVNNENSNPSFTNVTISGNTAGDGGGVYTYESAPAFANSIIWGNNTQVEDQASTPTYAHSLVQDATLPGTGNLDGATDPRFVAPESEASAPTTAGNYRLQASSPVINRGSNAALPAGVTTDLDGNPRIVNGTVDLGAYESSVIIDPITGLSATSSSPTVLGQSTTFTATLSAGTNVTYTWTFGDGVGTGSGATASYTYLTAGVFTATVTATNAAGSQQAQTVVTVTPITRFVLFFPWLAR